MKKATLLFLISTFIFIFYSGCKKSDGTQNVSALQLLTKAYMNAQRNVSTNNADFIDTLMQSADWNKISSGSFNKSEFCIYVPVKYNNNTTGLVFIFNRNANEIEEGYLLEISGTNYTSDPVQTITDFYGYRNNNFTGSLARYSFANTFKWEMAYKDGKNIYRKAIMNSSMVQASFYANKITTNGTSQKKTNSTGQCQDWYLVTYYDDGSEDWDYITTTCNGGCTAIRQISKGNNTETNSVGITLNCGGGGGATGGSGEEPSVDTVGELLTKPCYSAVLKSLMGSGLTNELTDIILNTFGSSETLNLTFEEAPTLIGDSTATAHTSPSGGGKYLNIVTTLNESKLASASQEYIAETIFHEVIHAFLDVNLSVTGELNQHVQMIQTYVQCELTALQEVFPYLSKNDGLSLILGGMGQVQELQPATFNSVISSYNLTLTEIVNTNTYYERGVLGHACPNSNNGSNPTN